MALAVLMGAGLSLLLVPPLMAWGGDHLPFVMELVFLALLTAGLRLTGAARRFLAIVRRLFVGR